MMKVVITQIQVVYDPDDNIEVLYGLDSYGSVYWYRHFPTEEKVSDGTILKPAGWVKLDMIVAEEKLIKNDNG